MNVPYFARGPRQITLPGGQPAWLTAESAGNLFGASPGRYPVYVRLDMPWSWLTITLRMSQVQARQVFDSIRSRPVEPERLVLPDGIDEAELGRYTGGIDVLQPIEAKEVGPVRALVGELADVVPGGAACEGYGRWACSGSSATATGAP